MKICRKGIPAPLRQVTVGSDEGGPVLAGITAYMKLKYGKGWSKMQGKYMPHQGAREVARRLRQSGKVPS